MNNFKFKSNTLLICPTNYKEQVLQYNTKNKIISNIKFETIEEYKKNYLFDYGIDAIKYMVKKYDLSVENTIEIIENLYYVDENQVYNKNKLDQLASYKKELKENDCLIYNPFYLNYLSNKNIVVAGYGELDSFSKKILSGKNVHILAEDNEVNGYDYYGFDTIEQEIEFLYNKIFDLLRNKKDINNIYVVNANKSYEPYFKRFNTYYPFTISYGNSDKLLGTIKAKHFLTMLNNDSSKEEIYEWLNNSGVDQITKKLIELLNKYCSYDLKKVKDLVVFDLEKISLPTKHYLDVVECVSLNKEFTEDDYVFLIGFNDKTPAMKRDTDYITDNIKPLVGLDNTETTNIRTKKNFLNNLAKINNLTISYCLNSPFEKYNPSTLINTNWNKLNYDFDYSYSKEYNKVKLAYYLDELRKYNTIHKDLRVLKSNYDLDYASFDNRFTGLKYDQITAIKKPVLSYSSMDVYNKCAFRYYLQAILGINDYQDSFYARIGTFCHAVLQDYCLNPIDFNFDQSWDKVLKQQENRSATITDAYEEYFMNSLKEEVRKDVDILAQQRENSYLNQVKCENAFNVQVTKDIKFKGFIDKIMYKNGEDGRTVVSVVDYKTSKKTTIEKKLFKYGMSLQLPSYLYLLKNADKEDLKADKIDFGGFYLQHILNFDLTDNGKTTLEQRKKDTMKLDGFSSEIKERIELIDNKLIEGKASESIEALKITKDGKVSSARIYSDEEFEQLVELVRTKIIEAGSAILKGEFMINPKIIDGSNKSCEFCPYGAICYRSDANKVYITTQKQQEENKDGD